MKRDLFRRYVWLVEIVRHAKKLQFEEIAELWALSPLNDDNSPLALRTFHNHRHAIDELFSIRIVCDRSDHNRYHIERESDNDTRLKIWMLQTLGYSDIENDVKEMSGKFLFDSSPDSRYGLPPILEAIKEKRLLRLSCSVPTSDNKTSLSLVPYCVRCWQGNWVLTGEDPDSGKIHSLSLERILSAEPTSTPFSLPDNFDCGKWICHTYGTEPPSKENPEKVMLKIGGDTRDKVRTLPLHHSQKEMMTSGEFSIFEYNLVPGRDFLSTVLSHGSDTTVIAPESLRRKLADTLSRLSARYAGGINGTETSA